ncbi:maltotransferase domain-containing protein, partial [Actinomadura chokoriensis]|uniref:maltotransferase domain-containing protein n=1 Tax=Actinomadura chokoriensis TaxID=454156 RepID=UPI00356312D4
MPGSCERGMDVWDRHRGTAPTSGSGHMQVKLEGELGRIPILDVAPVVGCGRWPAKAVVGETVEVSATVFREGHE